MNGSSKIAAVDFWQVRIPLVKVYHLSSIIGATTHSNSIVLRLTLEDGTVGWGEGSPQEPFDGYTMEKALDELAARGPEMIGTDVADWVDEGRSPATKGAPNAALDVACFDALGKVRGIPVWKLLGEKVHDRIDVLWPTSSGTAAEDLEAFRDYYPRGFRSLMLKMGSRPIPAEIERVHEVVRSVQKDVKVGVDANQGWTRDEAIEFLEGCRDLPLVMVEQPLAAHDIDGLSMLAARSPLPISVDESLGTVEDARRIVASDAAAMFSVKVSKNGGLTNARKIAHEIRASGRTVLMNSMIELGITQAASLHLGATLDCLASCGHAYMSTLRLADDITDFSDLVSDGRVSVPDRPGLGIEVSTSKIKEYQVEQHSAN